tara:strand:- start:252 stop:893 length:642 start_codon:yes stop_codon:yes gene_type:complete
MSREEIVNNVISDTFTYDHIYQGIQNSPIISSMYDVNIKYVEINGFDPLIKALTPDHLDKDNYGIIKNRWKNEWPKVSLFTIRSMFNWKNKIEEFIDHEIKKLLSPKYLKKLMSVSITIWDRWEGNIFALHPIPAGRIGNQNEWYSCEKQIQHEIALHGIRVIRQSLEIIVKRIIDEIWVPQALSKLQQKYKEWYYTPGNPGFIKSQERYIRN